MKDEVVDAISNAGSDVIGNFLPNLRRTIASREQITPLPIRTMPELQRRVQWNSLSISSTIQRILPRRLKLSRTNCKIMAKNEIA